jgi:hypothetical protein
VVVNFHVVNQAGVPQVAYANGQLTDGFGSIPVTIRNYGATVSFTRSSNAAPCGAPEGAAGVTYRVDENTPSDVTITLPNVGAAPYDPALRADERGLLGLVNAERAKSGIGPLTSPTVLTDAADRLSPLFGRASGRDIR